MTSPLAPLSLCLLLLLLAAAQPAVRAPGFVLAPYYAPGYVPAGPERALAPGTLAAQRAIWAHQFPASCVGARYIYMPEVRS